MLVKIEGMTYGGAGIGKKGKSDVAIVPFALPGELVEVEDQGVIAVIERSADRADPGCIHFGHCGGCHYQHARYPAQLQIKLDILRTILSQAVAEIPKIEVRAGEPWAYRNRTRMRVESVAGVIRSGYNQRGSNEFLAIKECPIASPLLWRAASSLNQLAGQHKVSRRWLEKAQEVELFCSGDESSLQLTLLLRERLDREDFSSFCLVLKETVPELVGGEARMHEDSGRKVRKSWNGATWGANGLIYEAAGQRYWVSRGAFFQANRFLVDKLVELVTKERTGVLAWDLYAGAGLFARRLATSFDSLVAVEGNPFAVADLRQSGSNVRVVQASTVAFLRQAVLEREQPKFIVMDPPRAGIGTEGCRFLAQIGAPLMVYVSCDPTTLGRDLTVLVRAGYVMERVWMLDMFPQTFHIETVVQLRLHH